MDSQLENAWNLLLDTAVLSSEEGRVYCKSQADWICVKRCNCLQVPLFGSLTAHLVFQSQKEYPFTAKCITLDTLPKNPTQRSISKFWFTMSIITKYCKGNYRRRYFIISSGTLLNDVFYFILDRCCIYLRTMRRFFQKMIPLSSSNSSRTAKHWFWKTICKPLSTP